MSEMNLNLIPSKAKFQAVRIKLQKQIRLVITVILLIWLSSGAILFLLAGIYRVRMNTATTAQKKALQNYGSMQDNIVTSQKLKYKAKMVGGALNSRFEYGSSFEAINKLFPPSINLKNYDLMDDGGVFQVKGVVSEKPDVDLLEDTIESINRGESDKFKSARLVSLVLKNGVWDFSMEVSLK